MKNILFLFLAITVCATIQGGVLSERQIITEETSVSGQFTSNEPTTISVTLPETLNTILSDEPPTITAIISGETDMPKGYNLSWYICDKNGNTDTSKTILTQVSKGSDGKKGTLVFAGGIGITYIKAVIIDKNTWIKYESNLCCVTVGAPKKTITDLRFEKEMITAGIRENIVNQLIISPQDATFTQISYESSNSEIVQVTKTGTVTTKETEGQATITAKSLYPTGENAIIASYTVNVTNNHPVTEIQLGTDGKIEIEYKDIYRPTPIILPENATVKKVKYTIKDNEIASFYQDNIVAHKIGETTLTATAQDNSGVSVTVRLIVKDLDRTPYDGYQDGTFILNEAWYGHENGDMNFLTKDQELMYRVYERENKGEAFGATSCYGIVYGGNLYVTSKQEEDAGDPNPGGGRLVIMDAKTLKKIKGFETIGGGDGRSIVGVNPNKIYLGTTKGVVVFDVKNMKVGNIIEGTQGIDLYNGQIGDMIKAGKYVFAIQQDKGTNIIDTETDQLIKCIENVNIQGITQSFDGNVWLASSTTLDCLNPETLEIEETLNLPQGAEITCSWGAWRPTPFCASRTKNNLYWNGGSNIMEGGSNYYCYEIGTEINNLKPLFTISELEGSAPETKQTTYGTLRYDDRTDELLIMTTQSGGSTNYEHNWIHIVNGTSGELKKTLKLKQYYWFQAIPIFPDKYAPEINNLEESLSLKINDGTQKINLAGKITDKDNLAYNITKTLKNIGNETIATATLENKLLVITPKSAGETTITLAVESNGVITEQPIHITVSKGTGINDIETPKAVYSKDNQIIIYGYEGYQFVLYDESGKAVSTFQSTNKNFSIKPNIPSGLYILKGNNATECISYKVML